MLWKKVGAGEVGWDTTKKREAKVLDNIEVSDDNYDDMEELVYVDPSSLQEDKEEEWRRENISESDYYETHDEADGVNMDVEDMEDYSEKEVTLSITK